MIIYKEWVKKKHNRVGTHIGDYFIKGWFLFGVIPLYIRREGSFR